MRPGIILPVRPGSWAELPHLLPVKLSDGPVREKSCVAAFNSKNYV